jgi:hypothetical protein
MEERRMMLNRWLMAAAAGMAVLVVSSSFDPADARSRGAGARGFHGGGHARAFSGRAFHGGHRFHGGRRFARRGIGVGVVGVPLAYGAYSYGYYGSGGGGCRSLRLRAEATGSAYWWSRYHACLDGYDY